MVFPESDTQKRAVDIDVESLPKLNLRNYCWMTVLSLGKHLYCQLLLFWTLHYQHNCILDLLFREDSGHLDYLTFQLHFTSIYQSTYSTKQTAFQNGFNPRMPTFASTEPIYLRLPGQSPYFSYPLTSATPFHPQGSLPIYRPVVSPDMAKLFDRNS